LFLSISQANSARKIIKNSSIFLLFSFTVITLSKTIPFPIWSNRIPFLLLSNKLFSFTAIFLAEIFQKEPQNIIFLYLTTYLSTLLKYSPISDSTFIILFHILFTLNSLFIFSLTTCTFLIIIIFFFLCSPLFIRFRYNLSTFDILSFLRWSTILRFQLHPLITIWQLFLQSLITFFIPFIINFL